MAKLAKSKNRFLSLFLLTVSSFLNAETYSIGVEEVSYMPFYGFDSLGNFIGIAPDILNAFAEKSGIDFEFKPYPILRLTENYLSGQLDFRYPDNPDWNAPEQAIYYSMPLMVVLDGLIVRKENTGRSIIKYRDIGTIRGYTAPSLEVYIKYGSIRLIEINTYDSMIAMLVSGRFEAGYLSVIPAFYTARQKGLEDRIAFDRDLPFDVANHNLSSIEHRDILEKFNIFLREEKELIDGIYESWNVEKTEIPDINS
ncbi:MAG: transporter substrate-binding domain-containing protein [Spirochaetales bacterium]|nr:transporter substrate-binding domain-containing protein [Spirochaetales bacterium]